MWVLQRIRRGEERSPMGSLGSGREDEIAALRDDVGAARHEMGELQERLDFAERLLSQARDEGRVPHRRDT
jgi:hypothetical protein